MKEIWHDLWKNKPLLFGLIAVLVVLLYVMWHNSQLTANQPGSVPGVPPVHGRRHGGGGGYGVPPPSVPHGGVLVPGTPLGGY